MVDIPDSPNSQAWLEFADEDFGFAVSGLSDPETHFFPQICFHFQQAAEKYLKAYIVARKLEFKKIHELPTLLQICQRDNPDFGQLKEECDFLTEFYFESRYPADLPPSNITREMAEKAKEATQRIGAFVKEKLGIK
ncbi:MAG: HEPN domain-containing protein [Patescibacteria group bacterium]